MTPPLSAPPVPATPAAQEQELPEELRRVGARPAHLAPDPGTRMATMAWISIAAAGLCGSVVAISLLLTGLPGRVDEHTALIIGAATTCVGATVAAIVVGVVGRRAPREHRRTWILATVGLTSWSFGSTTWILTLTGMVPFAASRLAELSYLLSVLLIATSVLTHPMLGPPSARLRALVDATIVGGSGALLVWFIAARQMYAGSGDVVLTFFGMAYPAVEMGVAMACLCMVARAPRRSRDQAVGLLLAVAYAAWALADTLALGLRSVRGERLPLLPELPFVLGMGALAVACCVSVGRTDVSPWPVNERRLSERLGVAPAMAAVVAGVALVTDGITNGRLDSGALLLVTVVVVMVLARQSMTLRDNRELARSLRVTVDRLERQATHDGLTNLPNRSGLMSRIEQARRSAHQTGRRAALCFVDLDHLKGVNDSLGHHAGDILLEVLAGRLADVGHEVTRFGGDEFVVLVDDLPSIHAAQGLGDQLLREACRPTQIDGVPIRPSASVGIAVSEPGIDATELLRRADVALYRAKALGRRRATTYDASADDATRRQIDLEPELRRALDQDEFRVHYQPVIELTTGRLTGVEALLRWEHPRRGLLTPDAFLAEATSSGLLGAIGERTLMTVSADFAPVVARLPITVAVNLSTTELTHRGVVERVAHALETHGMPASALVIEITEDVVVDSTIRQTIDELRTLGVALAIDDFGTGNSSLRQLGTYPADTLKVDKIFVDRVEHEHDAVVITRAILGLARNLGLRTVAEGVETEAQAELLRDMGCDRAQGWWFSRAVPFDELPLDGAPFRAPRASRQSDGGPQWGGTIAPQPRSRSRVTSASSMIRASSSATGGRSPIAPTT
ncbi:MAG: putative bifunctional diguanylate cyclase/phosphodiesterase [Microthrixaceae bacterium]